MPIVAKPATLVEDHEYIWKSDPAIDATVTDWEDLHQQWLETGDPAVLERFIKPGEKPVLFVMLHPRGRLRRQLRDHVIQDSTIEGNLITKWSQAALVDVAIFCLKSADGLVDEKGKPLELARVVDTTAKASRISDDSIDLLDSVDEGLLLELGMRAFTLLTPGGNS